MIKVFVCFRALINFKSHEFYRIPQLTTNADKWQNISSFLILLFISLTPVAEFCTSIPTYENVHACALICDSYARMLS